MASAAGVAGVFKLPRSSRVLSLTPDKLIGSGGGTVAAGCAAVVLVGSRTLGSPCTADSRGAAASGVDVSGGASAGELVDVDAAVLDSAASLDSPAGFPTSSAGGGGMGMGLAVGSGMPGL